MARLRLFTSLSLLDNPASAFYDKVFYGEALRGFSLNEIKSMYKKGEIVAEKGFISSAYSTDDFIKSSRLREFDVII